MPLPTHKPHLFYLLSPEAVRLTLWGQNQHFNNVRKIKKDAQWLVRARGREFCLV
jgi:hypothetical protein